MATIRAKDLPATITAFGNSDYIAADENASGETRKVNKDSIRAGLGLATSRRTVVSVSNPTPDYVGQPGIDAAGKTYVAISLTGTMWEEILVNGKTTPQKLAAQTKTVVSVTNPTPDYIGQHGRDTSGKTYVAISLTGTMWETDNKTNYLQLTQALDGTISINASKLNEIKYSNEYKLTKASALKELNDNGSLNSIQGINTGLGTITIVGGSQSPQDYLNDCIFNNARITKYVRHSIPSGGGAEQRLVTSVFDGSDFKGVIFGVWYRKSTLLLANRSGRTDSILFEIYELGSTTRSGSVTILMEDIQVGYEKIGTVNGKSFTVRFAAEYGDWFCITCAYPEISDTLNTSIRFRAYFYNSGSYGLTLDIDLLNPYAVFGTKKPLIDFIFPELVTDLFLYNGLDENSLDIRNINNSISNFVDNTSVNKTNKYEFDPIQEKILNVFEAHLTRYSDKYYLQTNYNDRAVYALNLTANKGGLTTTEETEYFKNLLTLKAVGASGSYYKFILTPYKLINGSVGFWIKKSGWSQIKIHARSGTDPSFRGGVLIVDMLVGYNQIHSDIDAGLFEDDITLTILAKEIIIRNDVEEEWYFVNIRYVNSLDVLVDPATIRDLNSNAEFYLLFIHSSTLEIIYTEPQVITNKICNPYYYLYDKETTMPDDNRVYGSNIQNFLAKAREYIYAKKTYNNANKDYLFKNKIFREAPKVIIIGDSVAISTYVLSVDGTAVEWGDKDTTWSYYIKKYLMDEYEIPDLNIEIHAYGGYTYRDFMVFVEDIAIKNNPDLIIYAEFQTVEENDLIFYEQFIQLLREKTTSDIILATWSSRNLTVPYTGEEDSIIENGNLWNSGDLRDWQYIKDNIVEFHAFNFIRDVARRYNCELLDFNYKLFQTVLNGIDPAYLGQTPFGGESLSGNVITYGLPHLSYLGNKIYIDEINKLFKNNYNYISSNVLHDVEQRIYLSKNQAWENFKHSNNVVVLNGSWSYGDSIQEIFSDTNGDYLEFPFRGIGFDLFFVKYPGEASASHSILVDGILPSTIRIDGKPLEYSTEPIFSHNGTSAQKSHFYSNLWVFTRPILHIDIIDNVLANGVLESGDYIVEVTGVTDNKCTSFIVENPSGATILTVANADTLWFGAAEVTHTIDSKIDITNFFNSNHNYRDSADPDSSATGEWVIGHQYKFKIKSNWVDSFESGDTQYLLTEIYEDVGGVSTLIKSINKIKISGLQNTNHTIRVSKNDNNMSRFSFIKLYSPKRS